MRSENHELNEVAEIEIDSEVPGRRIRNSDTCHE